MDWAARHIKKKYLPVPCLCCYIFREAAGDHDLPVSRIVFISPSSFYTAQLRNEGNLCSCLEMIKLAGYIRAVFLMSSGSWWMRNWTCVQSKLIKIAFTEIEYKMLSQKIEIFVAIYRRSGILYLLLWPTALIITVS